MTTPVYCGAGMSSNPRMLAEAATAISLMPTVSYAALVAVLAWIIGREFPESWA